MSWRPPFLNVVGWDETALREYSRAIRENQDNFFVRLHRGDLHARLGRWQEAETDFREALKILPAYGDAWYRLALLSLTQNDVASYRHFCESWIALGASPRDDCYWLSRAVSLRPDAVENYRQIVQWARRTQSANYERGRFVLATMLVRAGHEAEAAKILSSLAAARDDSNPPDYSTAAACYFLAMAYQKLKNTEEFRHWLEEANRRAQAELAREDLPWTRKLELKLLREEMESPVAR